MIRIAIFAAAALLSGCATAQLDKGLNGLVGHNIKEAVAHLGYPDGQREVMGDTLYIWSTNRSGLMPFNRTTTTTGAVGGTPFYGTTNSMALMPVAFNCTVQIATTADGTIKTYQWEGNQPGCKRYARGF